jgi:uncharacterized protein (TIGR02611 family)
MNLTTVEQVRRMFRIVAGFTLLLVGVVMLVTPGPGWLVIFFGLGLLAVEFVWARRLKARIHSEAERAYKAVWRPGKSVSTEDPAESNKARQPSESATGGE